MPRLSVKYRLEQAEARQQARRRAVARARRAKLDQTFGLSRGLAFRVFVVLLTAGMLGFSVFAGYRTIACVWRWQDARSWVPVPAHIQTLQLAPASEDTHEAQCEYVYSHNGREYRGSRVGLESGPDNLGTWHVDTYQALYGLKNAGQPVVCYVDPSHPERAVLFRDLRLARLGFYLVFVVGFTMLALPVFIMYLASFDSTGARGEWVRRRLPVLGWLMLISKNPAAGMRLRSGLWFWWFPVGAIALTLLVAGTIAARALARHQYVEIFVCLFVVAGMLICVVGAVRRSRSRRP